MRNLRAAGEVKAYSAEGSSLRPITVVDLPPESAGAVLKEVLGPRQALPLRGFVLPRTFSVPPEAPLSDFITAPRSHRVFENVPARTV